MWFGISHGSCCSSFLDQILRCVNEKRLQDAEQSCQRLLLFLRQASSSAERNHFIFETFQLLGNIYREQSRIPETLCCYAQAMRYINAKVPNKNHPNLLYTAGVTAYEYSNMSNIVPKDRNALQRYAKLCFEQYLKLSSTNAEQVQLYLVNLYLRIGDIMNAIRLSQYSLDTFPSRNQLDPDFYWLAQQTVQKLPLILFKLFEYRSVHRSKELNERIVTKEKTDLKLGFPNPLGISRPILHRILKKDKTEFIFYNVNLFLTVLEKRLQVAQNGNVSRIFKLPIYETNEESSCESFLDQLGILEGPLTTTFSDSPRVEHIQQNALLRLLRSGKDCQKKDLESASADFYNKTATLLDELLKSFEEFFEDPKTVSHDGPHLEEKDLCASVEPMLYVAFPSLEDYISILYMSSQSSSPMNDTLGNVLLEFCNVFLERKSYIHTPHEYIKLLMRILPFVSREDLCRSIQHIAAICYSCLIMKPIPMDTLTYAFHLLACLNDRDESLWSLTYILLVFSLRNRHFKGFEMVEKLLCIVKLSDGERCWIESCKDVCEAELLVQNLTFPDYDKLDFKGRIHEAVRLQGAVFTLTSLVSKWFGHSSCSIPEPNVLNDKHLLREHVQKLSMAALALLKSIIPCVCHHRLDQQKHLQGAPSENLGLPSDVAFFMETLLAFLGDLFILQSFLSQFLQMSFQPTSISIFLKEALELGFDKSEGHPNTLISSLPPFLSSFCNKLIANDTNSSNEFVFDSLSHSTFEYSIKSIDIPYFISGTSRYAHYSDSSLTAESSLSDGNEDIDSVHSKENMDLFWTRYTFSHSLKKFLTGTFYLLRQDIVVCKLILLKYRKPLDQHKKTLLSSLLSRIRFSVEYITTCLTWPLRSHRLDPAELSIITTVKQIRFAMGRVEYLNDIPSFSILRFLEKFIGLLRKILEVESILFSSEQYEPSSDEIALKKFSLYGSHSLFVTHDLFHLPSWVVNLYKEAKALDDHDIWSQGNMTHCSGSGTFSIPLHILCICFDCFFFIGALFRWINFAKRQLSVLFESLQHTNSISVYDSNEKPITDVCDLADVLPLTLKTILIDAIQYLHFCPQEISQKNCFPYLAKCMSWDTKMLIVELVAISLMKLFGLPVCPHGSPPFDSCRLIRAQDYEESIACFVNRTESNGLPFRIAGPLALCLCVIVHKKLSAWYSETATRYHFPKIFRTSLADALEYSLFLDGLDSCSASIVDDAGSRSVKIPPLFSFDSLSETEWNTSSCNILKCISDPLFSSSLLDVFDDDDLFMNSNSYDDTVSLEDSQGSSVQDTAIYSALFKPWAEQWPFFRNYSKSDSQRFFLPLHQLYPRLNNRTSLFDLLKMGALLSTGDLELLLSSSNRQSLGKKNFLMSKNETLSSQNVHLKSSLLCYPFQSSSGMFWRPISDFQIYRIWTASILHIYFVDFCSGTKLSLSLIFTFLFHVLTLRPVFYCPKKLSEIAFESSIWGDRLGIFLRESHVLQPSSRTRHLVPYLPSCLLSYGGYSTTGLDINHLLDNLANISKVVALNNINIRSIGCAAYTHRHIFSFLDDRLSAEKPWAVLFPFDSLDIPSEFLVPFHFWHPSESPDLSNWEIPVRQGIQALLSLQLEQHLLAHCVHLSIKTIISGTKISLGESAECTLFSRYVDQDIQKTLVSHEDTYSSSISCSTCNDIAMEDSLRASVRGFSLFNLESLEHPLYQQDHVLSSGLESLDYSENTQLKLPKDVSEDKLVERIQLVTHLLQPFRHIKILNFLDNFALYGRCRVEHLLVHFSLCKLLCPTPSGVNFCYLKKLKQAQKYAHEIEEVLVSTSFEKKNTSSASKGSVTASQHHVFVQQIERLCEEAQEIQKTICYVTHLVGEHFFSSMDFSRLNQDNPLCYALSPHTLKLIRSFIWIPCMILARCLLLLIKYDLYKTHGESLFSLKHYILFLKSLIFLCQSLNFLVPDETEKQENITVSLASKPQQQKDQLPSQLRFITAYEAPPLIKLATLRLYLLLLGEFVSKSFGTSKNVITIYSECTRSNTSEETESLPTLKNSFCGLNSNPLTYPENSKHDLESFNVEMSNHTRGNPNTEYNKLNLSDERRFEHGETNSNNLFFPFCIKPSEEVDPKQQTNSPDVSSCFASVKSSCLINNSSKESGALSISESWNDMLGSVSKNVSQDIRGTQSSDYFANQKALPNKLLTEPFLKDSKSTYLEKSEQSFSCLSIESVPLIFCMLCPWEGGLLTLSQCKELGEICDKYDSRRSCSSIREEEKKIIIDFCTDLQKFIPLGMSYVAVKNDCLKAIKSLISCFGRSFSKLHLILARYYYFSSDSPEDVLTCLKPLLCKGLNLSHLFDTKSTFGGVAKPSDTVFLLYQQVLTFRLRHEEKIKYSLVVVLLSTLERFLDQQEGISQNLKEDRHLNDFVSCSLDSTLTNPGASILLDLPEGLLSARVLSWSSASQNTPTKFPAALQRRWKCLPESFLDTCDCDSFLFTLTYLIDLLQFHIKIAKRQHSVSRNGSGCLYTSNDTKGFSQLVCQTIASGLFIFSRKLASRIPINHLVVPWEFEKPCKISHEIYPRYLVTPNLVRQLISLVPLLPLENEEIKKSFISFVIRMANTFIVSDIEPTHFQSTDINSITDNQSVDVIAECHARCGITRLALRVIRQNNTFRFVKSLFPHHITDYPLLNQIFKTLFVRKKTDLKRRHLSYKSDRSLKKLKG